MPQSPIVSRRFSSYGLEFEIAADEAVIPLLDKHLPPIRSAPSADAIDHRYRLVASAVGGQRHYSLWRGRNTLLRAVDQYVALEALENALQDDVAQGAHGMIFVHAGVVSWRGRAIVIPGRSHSGKSTLIAELVRIGAAYYSDEFAVLDHGAMVHPYPRRLALREDRGVRRVGIDELGRVGTAPIPVGLVLVTRYRRGARWRPVTLTPANACLALIDNTVAVRKRSVEAVPVLSRAVREATAIASDRGDARRIAASVLRAVE